MDYHLHGKANLTELVHQTKDVLAEKKKVFDIFIMFCIIVCNQSEFIKPFGIGRKNVLLLAKMPASTLNSINT